MNRPNRAERAAPSGAVASPTARAVRLPTGLHVVLLSMAVVSCATLATPGAGDRDLPNAGVGPFRRLDADELLDVAPFVLSNREGRFREPTALALQGVADDGVGEMSVALYFVATYREGQGRDAPLASGIFRSRADDARSFWGAPLDRDHRPTRVLSPEAPWEGTELSGPSVLSVGDEIWLYYATANGIGLARSIDGFTFSREASPVFVDQPTPMAPSIVRLPSGRFCMMFGSGAVIAEAESVDGIHWTKKGIVLAPSRPVDESQLLPGERAPFDTARVADPVISWRTTPVGRFHVRVLYTGVDRAGESAIGFAARYGEEGPLTKNPTPVYAVGRREAAPTLFSWGSATMLYVQQEIPASRTEPAYPAIAAALAPATLTLPEPVGYSESP